MKHTYILMFLLCGVVGCGFLGDREPRPADRQEARASFDPLRPPSIPDLASGKQKPPTVEDLSEQLEQKGADWLYGDGLGKTMVNVGAVIAFPPYAIYLVGNAGLALFGQEPLYVSDLLPDEPREGYLTVYDAVTSVPGLVTSTVVGTDFRTPKRLQ